MRTLVLTMLVSALVAGCGKSRPTYLYTVGDKTLDLTVHDDPQSIQDDLLSNVKPLFDELVTGDSVAFQYRRSGPLDLGNTTKELEAKARAAFGDRATVSSTATTTSCVFRFFKDRDGNNGVEQSADGKEPFVVLCEGPSMEWGLLDHYLRDEVFSIDVIRRSIQHEWNR